MTKVIAPNSHYSGLSASVMFINGVGETDNEHLLQWFESKGYVVEHPEPEPEQESPPDDPPAGDPTQDIVPPEVEPELELGPEPESKPAKKGK